MAQKHATRNELAQALIDIWLQLDVHVCARKPGVASPVIVAPRATRDQLRHEILDIKLLVFGLLNKYKDLIDDEVILNNRRCAKRARRFAG